MTPILFYGVPSGCSFGSIVALEWLRQPYHLCRIDMPGQVQSEDYRRLNPLGETPTLRTAQGELLSESLAILNHLAAKGIAQGLGFAQGTPGFDRLNHRLAYLNTSFFGAYAPLWHALEHAQGDDGEALRELCGRPAALISFLRGLSVVRPTIAHCAAIGIAERRQRRRRFGRDRREGILDQRGDG